MEGNFALGSRNPENLSVTLLAVTAVTILKYIQRTRISEVFIASLVGASQPDQSNDDSQPTYIKWK